MVPTDASTASAASFSPFHRLAADKKPGAKQSNNTQGKDLSEVTYWFNPALKKACSTDHRWPDDWYTACSRLGMGGIPAAAKAKHVGHSTVQMTMRYTDFMPDINQAAAAKIDATMGSRTPTVLDSETK